MADTFNNWLIAYYKQQTPPFIIHTIDLEQTMVWPVSSTDLDNIKQIITDQIKTRIPDYVCNIVIINVMPITKIDDGSKPVQETPKVELAQTKTLVANFVNPTRELVSEQYNITPTKPLAEIDETQQIAANPKKLEEMAQDAVDRGDWDTAYQLMDEIEQRKQNAVDSRRRTTAHKKGQHAKKAKVMG